MEIRRLSLERLWNDDEQAGHDGNRERFDMGWYYHNPVAVTFGTGSLDQLPDIVGGREAVLVTFPEAQALGLVGRVKALLGDRLMTAIDQVAPNPDVANLQGMYAGFWRDYGHCDAVVAIGGGSTLDTAKALMVRTATGTFDELLQSLSKGASFKPARTKPLIAIPTTAGTGSEVTPYATIWDAAPERMKKYSLQLRETWPEAAIVDPELTLSLPLEVTLHSGLDALSHCLEAIWNVHNNPISDTFAVAAAREILAALPSLMRNLGDIGLRNRMAWAALRAGLAFSNTRTALAHSISYEMTLRYGLPHGLACSFTLPMVMSRALGLRADRDAVLAQIFGENLQAAPQRLAEFLEGLGVSTRFEAYGVPSKESQRMVAHALEGARGKNFIGSARG